MSSWYLRFLEYKIDSFGPRLVKMMERLDLFEREIKKKVSSNENSPYYNSMPIYNGGGSSILLV